MSRLGAAIISFVLMAASANAQTDSQAMILSGLSDCITDAIATSSVKVDGDMLIFSCSTAKAKTLYNFPATRSRLRSFWIATANSTIDNLATTLATTESKIRVANPQTNFAAI